MASTYQVLLEALAMEKPCAITRPNPNPNPSPNSNPNPNPNPNP